jgi:acetyl esterase
MTKLPSLTTISIALAATLFMGSAQEPSPTPDRLQTFKKTAQADLQLHIFEPKGHSSKNRRAAIVFFFGGGWVGGNPNQFYPHCRHLADQGLVAISAEYRVKNQHGTTPFDCVKDGKSAIRWVRENAHSLGINPRKIAAGGGSAGGHVAAATATVIGLDEDEKKRVSSTPNALVLFNPVYDNGLTGYGYDRVKDRYKEISPMHNIRKGMPPAIVFLGTQDKLIPVETGSDFKKQMTDVGSRSELFLYDGEGHGFFNHGKKGNVFYEWTVIEMDRFLRSLGYMKQ